MRLALAVVLAALCGAAHAAPVIVCSTGDSTASAGGCGPGINSPGSNNLSADGNWYVASNPAGAFFSQAYVTINNLDPLQSAGPWLANNANDINGVGAGSSWIVLTNNQSNLFFNGHVYFSTQFVLSATTDLEHFAISGDWLADDYGLGIFLNGTAISQASLPAFGGEGGPMTPFAVTPGQFVVGANTLTFEVQNDSTDHGALTDTHTGSPLGVRVLFTAAGVPAPTGGVPEPSTWALLLVGFGLAGSGLRARHGAIPAV